MAKHSRHRVLSDAATHDKKSGDLRTVIETPKGSRNKYRYDPDCDCFSLATTLPDGMAFPFDFGFIPSTLGDDGDPLDVLVLMDAPVIAGCVLQCRAIGVIEAREKTRGKRWEQNDRLIAVASHARTHDGVKTLRQLRPHTLDDIKACFVDYNRLRDKRFEIRGEHGRTRAAKLVKKRAAAYAKKALRSDSCASGRARRHSQILGGRDNGRLEAIGSRILTFFPMIRAIACDVVALIRRQGGQFVPDVGPRPPRADMLPLIVRAHGLPRGLTP